MIKKYLGSHAFYKLWHFVKPSYFFILHLGPFWQKPFCVLSIVFSGDKEALEFAEKSLDLSKFNHCSINKKVNSNALYTTGVKRYVINIDGQESQPSPKWANVTKHAHKISNPIDPTYKLDIPVAFIANNTQKVNI